MYHFTIILLYSLLVANNSAHVINKEQCSSCDNDRIFCPLTSNECPSLTIVPDPCGCCIGGVCPAQETETCSNLIPCDRGLYCDADNTNEINIDEGICRCRRDKRPVCATDNKTYISICDMEKQTHKTTLFKWGHCDKAPEIITASEDVAVIVGQPIALDCEVKGSPIPVITWKFYGKNGDRKMLPSDDQVTAVLVRGGPEHMMVTSWMQIVEARTTDEGIYTCVASNEHGTTTHQAKIAIKK